MIKYKNKENKKSEIFYALQLAQSNRQS